MRVLTLCLAFSLLPASAGAVPWKIAEKLRTLRGQAMKRLRFSASPPAELSLRPRTPAPKLATPNTPGWHVIVYHKKQRPEDPWLLVDKVFRDSSYRSSRALLRDVSRTRRTLKARYPAPDYTVVTGKGPPSSSPDFATFVGWLLNHQ